MLLTLDDLHVLLASKINEERLLALIILTKQYQNENDQGKERLYQFYMNHLKYVNNWNLVDASAHLIIGAHLWDKDRSSLLNLATSEILWERRISIVSSRSRETKSGWAREIFKKTHARNAKNDA